jgi:hypothetical protein
MSEQPSGHEKIPLIEAALNRQAPDESSAAQQPESDHANSDVDEQQASVRGLSKVIATIQLARVRSKLEPIEQPTLQGLTPAWRQQSKHVKIGRRGAINMRLQNTFDPELDEEGRVKPETIDTFLARRLYKQNVRKIEKVTGTGAYREDLVTKRAELEQKLGIRPIKKGTEVSSPEGTVTKKTPPKPEGAKPLDMLGAEAVNNLRNKEVRLVTHEVYEMAMRLAKEHEVVDKDLIATALGVASDSVIVEFTKMRLANNWITDDIGRVLRTSEEIDDILTEENRRADIPRSFSLLEAHKLFDPNKQQGIINHYVEQDTSDHTPEEKALLARRMALRLMLRAVEEADRPMLGRVFERWLKDEMAGSNLENISFRPLTEVVNPVKIYDEVKELAKDILKEDDSDESEDTKQAKADSAAWEIITDGLLEDERDELREQFALIEQTLLLQARKKRGAKGRPEQAETTRKESHLKSVSEMGAKTLSPDELREFGLDYLAGTTRRDEEKDQPFPRMSKESFVSAYKHRGYDEAEAGRIYDEFQGSGIIDDYHTAGEGYLVHTSRLAKARSHNTGK